SPEGGHHHPGDDMSDQQQPDNYKTERTYSSTEISRRIKGRTAPDRLEPTPAGRRFAEQLHDLIAQHERERIAERALAGGPDEDRDPFEVVRAIADDWDRTADDPDSRAELLDHLADSLDTSEVRALRLAAEAAAAITPRLIVAESAAGVRADVIADDLGHANPSYVYRILREHRAAQ
ncbi:hypothetical protein NGM36_13160, partial [Streptomyces mutabilis]|nr:hypothetical protein [Streptomyces mutabilis]